MELLNGLNPEQQEAVQSVEGPLMVHAGPGSGKTLVIVRRIAYLICKAGIKPRNILAVTFSRKAASEIKRRLVDLLGKDAVCINTGTIHSICLSILRREGVPQLGRDFDVIDDEERDRLIKKCVENTVSDLQEIELRRVRELLSYAKTNLIDPESMHPGTDRRFDDISLAIYRNYHRLLKENRSLDYDDMLVFTFNLLRDNNDIRKKYQKLYQYILVDEFQDTSSLQYRVIKLLAESHRNICVVGDPDQTIYSWRHANIANIEHFRRDFPGTRIIGMQDNYRSTRTIIDAANALIARNRIRKDKKLHSLRNKGEPIIVIKLQDEESEARYIADEIIAVRKRHNLQYRDFAVLYRINAQSRPLEDMFLASGLPFRLATGMPFYKRKEIQDIVSWLRTVRNPYDDAALKRILKIAVRGLGNQAFTRMLQLSQIKEMHLFEIIEMTEKGDLTDFSVRTRHSLANFHNLLQNIRALSRSCSIITLIKQIIEKTGYREYLQSEDDPEDRWENILELMSMASTYEHLHTLEAIQLLLNKVGSACNGTELKQDSDAITFNTLHGAKGTEYPVVFIAGLEEGLLPHSRAVEDPTKLEEERRLCYVGITRAKDIVYLTHTSKRNSFGQEIFRNPSRFLYEIPGDLIISRDMTQTQSLLPGA